MVTDKLVRDKLFWNKVKITDQCWIWLAAVNTSGYGTFRCNDGIILAHIYAYGIVPDNKELHHRCRNKRCIRKHESHVVALSRKEHRQEDAEHKIHCINGHPYIEENIYYGKRGRECRTCRSQQVTRCKLKKKFYMSN